jgi:hypothetical protein
MSYLKPCGTFLVALVVCGPAPADIFGAPVEEPPVIHSHYGGVGLLRTRTARMAADSTLAASVSWAENQQRYGLTFQAAPWLETTFSYSGFDRSPPLSDTFDRQFDIKIKLWNESTYIPQVAVGLQDFLGTGLFSGEYVVASKRLGPLDLSFGVGWGQLGSRGDLDNPLRIVSDRFRSRTDTDGGGQVNFGEFFSGEDVGFFGGVSYQTPIEGLQLVAEYDGDDRSAVDGLSSNPLNFGAVYNLSPGIQLTASYLGMEDINLQATISAPVGENVQPTPTGSPPPLFYVREDIPAPDGGADGLIAPVAPPLFTPLDPADPSYTETIGADLARLGVDLLSVETGENAVRVRVENSRYRSASKAVGRVARILSRYAPASIETFQVVLVTRNLESAEFKLNRTILEESAREIGYSMAPPALGFAYIPPGSEPVNGRFASVESYPKFDWSVGPDVRYGLFDPSDPLRVDIRAQASGRVDIAPGLSVTGQASASLFGNIDDALLNTNSQLPQVRTNAARYNDETTIGIDRLVGEYLFQPAPNVYAKASAGLLEQMFGGAGGEVLWRPPNSRLAYGAEVYYARQRDFDTLLTFQDYDVVTGHASVYWDTPYAHWDVALHAGRYLAKDWGATVEVSRRFPNGWEIGAFATLTDVPFDEFGEGSFDKGITLSVPLDWGLPRDTKASAGLNLRPIQRDGGARLNPGSRLYRLTREGSRGEVAPQWNSFAH